MSVNIANYSAQNTFVLKDHTRGNLDCADIAFTAQLVYPERLILSTRQPQLVAAVQNEITTRPLKVTLNNLSQVGTSQLAAIPLNFKDLVRTLVETSTEILNLSRQNIKYLSEQLSNECSKKDLVEAVKEHHKDLATGQLSELLVQKIINVLIDAPESFA